MAPPWKVPETGLAYSLRVLPVDGSNPTIQGLTNPLASIAPKWLLYGEVAGWTSSQSIMWGDTIYDSDGQSIMWGDSNTSDDYSIMWGDSVNPPEAQ